MLAKPPRTPTTKKVKAYVEDTSVRDLPLGVWRLPPDRWVLSLRRQDGTREIRNVRGDVFAARAHRDSLLGTGRYTMAWLMEAREDTMAQRRPRRDL